MAKTVLQYSCLYILPFLFGMCLSGLEQKQFLTIPTFGKTKYCGLGKFLLYNPPNPQNEKTQVILNRQQTLEPETDGLDQISVYMKTNTNGLDESQLLDLLYGVDVEGWVTFPISENPITVGEDTHYTISVLPGGTKYPNIYFETSGGVSMCGYKVGNDIRFLGNETETIQKLQSASGTSGDFKMAVIDDRAKVKYFKVKVDTSSIKVSGGGHILDLVLSGEPKPTDSFNITL